MEGRGKPVSDTTQFSFMNNRRFYTETTVTDSADELLLTRLGANDPSYNLRRDPAFIVRRQAAADTTFVSTIESHGSYDPVSESAVNSYSNIEVLKLILDDENCTAVSIEDIGGNTSLFILSNKDPSASKQHRLDIDNEAFQWQGPFYYTDK